MQIQRLQYKKVLLVLDDVDQLDALARKLQKACWFEVLGKLKYINLSELVRTPDFSGIPNLESLVLEGCVNLVVTIRIRLNFSKIKL
ncbi:hypothetical protein H5410_019544 [Solanum commersonii]|uniref:Uncharacterized protein n=1 Tax=Solanum commersonii TaxID=4109 RepID=A0A9J5Z8N2_SOLCO|nr:hypothetical protein H5410_019544 [Solanum commersonii]